MLNLGYRSTGIEKSRRNFMKIGAILAFYVLDNLSKTDPAFANCGNDKPVGKGEGCERFTNCFMKGTVIRTVNGNRKIEDLTVGDWLPTAFGGRCPIQWIGRYLFRKSDPTKAWAKDVLPVRVASSALGANVPCTDLYITKAHALLIDGVLVAAGSLINGTTITIYEAHERDELEFFHIKLARHDVIYAEGAPCETLLDTDENTVDFAEYFHRYGPPTTKEAPCVPRFGFNGDRGEIKSRFRSALSPWIDRRQRNDIIRDELEEWGIALTQQLELVL